MTPSRITSPSIPRQHLHSIGIAMCRCWLPIDAGPTRDHCDEDGSRIVKSIKFRVLSHPARPRNSCSPIRGKFSKN